MRTYFSSSVDLAGIHLSAAFEFEELCLASLVSSRTNFEFQFLKFSGSQSVVLWFGIFTMLVF